MKKHQSTKKIALGSTAFRQPNADSHCKYLHGYLLSAKLWFECNKLDNNNWVVDFGGLKELKEYLINNFDHKTCISANDPHLSLFKDLDSKEIISLNIFKNGVGIEKFAEFIFNETNEFIREKTEERCWVVKCEVWEHLGNSAIYTR